MNKKDEQGRTPLHLACQYNRRDVAEAMVLEQGANTRARDHRGRHPAHTAAMENGANVIELLFADDFVEPERMPDIDAQDEKGWTALHLAARQVAFFPSAWLYGLPMVWGAIWLTRLTFVRYGHIDCVKELVAAGAGEPTPNPNPNLNPALAAALTQ